MHHNGQAADREHSLSGAGSDAESRRGARPEPPPGTWALLDQRWRVLAVGDETGERLYRGTSPRRIGAAARDLLLQPMEAAEAQGARGPHDGTAWWNGIRWRTRVVLLTGPVSGRIVGRLGCYLPADSDEAFPQQLRVGAIEWELPPPGTGEPRSWWDERMYPWVYDMPTPEDFAGYWPLAGVVDTLLDRSDRPVVQQIINTIAHNPTDKLMLYQYWALDHTRLMRVAIRRDTSNPRWARGMVMRLHDSNHDHSASETMRTARMLDAMVKLSTNPLFAVDALYRQIYLTDQRFARLGLWLPESRAYPDMVHPDDHAVLQEFFESAAKTSTSGAPEGPVAVRFATADPDTGARRPWNEATRVRMVGMGWLPEVVDDPHHVLCKVVGCG